MGVLFKSLSGQDPGYYRKKKETERKLGRSLSKEEFDRDYYKQGDGSSLSATGTSVFDPVLCEIMYKWFSADGDSVIDCFAGGSVRGIVAAETGRQYTGVDLREEQVEANRIQAEEICNGITPVWICGDSKNIKQLAPGEYDFIMTCPPYGDLEVYSDKPDAISNMEADEFDKAYREILANTVSMLKEDRFACIVVGNYRDRKGFLRDLVGLTVRSMESAGAKYYNDFIVVTPNGSLPIRAGNAFSATRKMGRTHQYCLVFVKGDPKKAAKRLGEVDMVDLSDCDQEE